eukprot:scaffold20.g7893.t1
MDSLLEPEDTLGRQALQAPWGAYGRSATLGVVSLLSKLLLNVLNTTTVDGLGRFRQTVMEREEGVGLITFFQSGKVLPIVRGEGLGQPIMRAVAGEVAAGRWLHIFPEGKVNYTGTLGPLRWGVGKVICDVLRKTDRDPIVLPFYHSGMGRVLPKRGRLPRAGNHVHVVVGQPLDLRDVTCRCNQPGENQQAVWHDITARVQQALLVLEVAAPPNTDQVAGGRRAHQEERERSSEGALPA